MRQFKKQISGKKALIIILCLSFLVLLLPNMIRFWHGNNTLVGHESYYNAWHAENFEGSLVETNNLVHGSRIGFNAYQILISGISFFLGTVAASKIIPFILGILSAILFYIVMIKLGFTHNKSFLSSLLFVASPIYMYVFSVSSMYSLVIFLNLLGLYCFIMNGKFFYAALASYAIIPFLGLYNSLASIAVLITYAALKKKQNIKLIILTIIVLSAVYNGVMIFEFGLPQKIAAGDASFLQKFVSEIGAGLGLSMFMLFLVVSGILVSWEKKKLFYPLYIFMILLALTTIYIGDFANIYLNLVFSAFAGISIFRLIRRKWEFPVIRNLLLGIILVGIVFSGTFYSIQIANSEPYERMISPLKQLKQADQGIVLSHPKNAHIIRYYADKQPFTETSYNYLYYDYALGDYVRKDSAGRIFSSIYLADAVALLENNQIEYIYVDENMKKGLVWDENEELLFLLSNRETFKKLHGTDNEVYKIK